MDGEGDEGLFLSIHHLSCLLAQLVKLSASPLQRSSSSKFVGVWFGADLCVWDSPQLSVNAASVTTVCREGVGMGRFHVLPGYRPQPEVPHILSSTQGAESSALHCLEPARGGLTLGTPPHGPPLMALGALPYTPQAASEHSLKLLVHHGFWPSWVTFLFSCANMAGW